jgi:hypothetical protein
VGLVVADLDPRRQIGEAGEQMCQQRQEQRDQDPRHPVVGSLRRHLPRDGGEALGEAGGWWRG